jgi:hypothetical protein
MIFNRWGEQIFEAHSIDIGWRGTCRGTPLPVGVYKVRAESYKGLVVEHAGSVTLIR